MRLRLQDIKKCLELHFAFMSSFLRLKKHYLPSLRLLQKKHERNSGMRLTPIKEVNQFCFNITKTNVYALCVVRAGSIPLWALRQKYFLDPMVINF